MKKLNFMYTLLITLSMMMFLSACNSGTEGEVQDSAPVLRDFIVSVDEGTPLGQSLGNVIVESEGTSSIDSFRLEGMGYSNFLISNSGEIFINTTDLNATTTSRYDLSVVARNSYGDSNVAAVTIQVVSSNQPVINDLILYTDDWYTGSLVTIDATKLLRDGVVATPDINNIKSFEIQNNIDGKLSISNDPLNSFGSLRIDTALGNTQTSYDVYIRAININDEVGPYAKFTINVNNTGYVPYTDPIYTDTTDYIGNDIYSATYVGLESSYGSSIDYLGDRDVFSFDIYNDPTNVTIYTDGTMDTVGRLYDDTYFEMAFDDDGAGNGTNFMITYTLSPGRYYIDVAGFNDTTTGSYTLYIYSY